MVNCRRLITIVEHNRQFGDPIRQVRDPCHTTHGKNRNIQDVWTSPPEGVILGARRRQAMALFLLKLLARVMVFGVALTFAVRRSSDVKVEPRSALPIVAAVFTLLNVALYWGLKTVLNIGTLWMFWFRTASIVTVAHIALHFANL